MCVRSAVLARRVPRTAPAIREEDSLIPSAQRPGVDAVEGAPRDRTRVNRTDSRAPPDGPHAPVRLGGPETHDPTAADTWVEEIPYADRLIQA